MVDIRKGDGEENVSVPIEYGSGVNWFIDPYASTESLRIRSLVIE
jgi:hypothetical protein